MSYVKIISRASNLYLRSPAKITFLSYFHKTTLFSQIQKK